MRGPSGARRTTAGARQGTSQRQRAPERQGAQRNRRPRKREGGSDLLARIFVAVPAAIVAIVFIDLGGLPFALFMVVLGVATMSELYRLLARWRPVALVGFASMAAMVLVGRYYGQRDVLLVFVATLPVVFLAVLARGNGVITVAVAGTMFGVLWIGLAFAHAELLRELKHGDGIVIDVAVGTFLGDTGAYLGGRLFGRQPLAPQISPHKTIEGLVCGMLVAIVTVFIAGLYQPWLHEGRALVLGFAIAVLAPIGDLFESAVKRDAHTKDAGHLFGAHGGALDRFDAISFTIVAGYWIWFAYVH